MSHVKSGRASAVTSARCSTRGRIPTSISCATSACSCAAARQRATRNRQPAARSQQPDMPRILLVEDNEMNRDMLSRRLQRRGFTVEIAVDGVSGVDRALEGGWDLILMDMSLPEIDGWEATRRIRAAGGKGKMP